MSSTGSTMSAWPVWILNVREAVPACSSLATRSSPFRQPPPARPSSASRSRAGTAQAGRLSAEIHGPIICVSREALRCLPAHRGVTFQRTRTWKESPDPEREAKPDRIEEVLDHFPDRVLAFDEFGPLGIRPGADSGWARQSQPDRLPTTYHRTHDVRYFHDCYSVGYDRLWGVNCRSEGAVNTLAALKSIRAARHDGAPIYVIMDNLSAHKGAGVRHWAKTHKVELCFTPDPGPARLPAPAQRQRPSPRRPGRRTQGTRPHPV